MKSEIPAGGVVVGTDGSAHAELAVLWAAAQAASEGRPLDLVHAYGVAGVGELPWVGGPGLDRAVLAHAVRDSAASVLHDAQQLAEHRAPGVEVRTHALHSDAREALVTASTTAHLLVVGSRGRGPWKRLVLGSVSSAVAREAECPVVVCRPGHPQSTSARVVVGVDGTPACTPVLEFAFEQASRTGAPLTVTHTFKDLPGDEGPDEGHDGLAHAVLSLQDKYPDVAVDLRADRGLVDECLSGSGPQGGLVVIGRRSPHGWGRLVEASNALAVLEHATTTVVVVPENSSTDDASTPARPEERNQS